MNKNGVALLLALFILILVSLLVIAFLELTTVDLQIVNNHLNRNKALYIAEAGVEDAISKLIKGQSPPTSVEFPSGSGNTYNVTYNSNSGKITSIGTLTSGEQVNLEVRVSVVGSLPHYNVKIICWREI